MNRTQRLKIVLAGGLVVVSAVMGGCAPTVFGVPETQWKQMTPEQQQAQIQTYNAQQQRAAQEKPMWDALGAVIKAAEGTPKVQDATTHTHCSNNNPPPVCTTNPDGSVHCTQHIDSSCTSFGL